MFPNAGNQGCQILYLRFIAFFVLRLKEQAAELFAGS